MIQAILVDSREPEWIKSLTFGGVPATVTLLEHGDIQMMTDDALLVIERKSPDDFLNTLDPRKGRSFFGQISGCLQTSRYTYLVITGYMTTNPLGYVISDRGVTGWKEEAVQGALLYCQEIGAHIVYCNGDAEFEKTVLRLGNRKYDQALKVYPARNVLITDPREAFLAMLPGIAEQRAHQLLEDLGTPANVLMALSDEDWKLQGIGPVIRERYKQFIGIDSTDILCFAPKEKQNG